MTPKIVCLCGSTRFSEAYQQANLNETLAGNIVLTIGCDMKADAHLFAGKSPDELAQIKARLDELHLHKIKLADEVLILNVDGYIGSSTDRELTFALDHNKKVRFLEEWVYIDGDRAKWMESDRGQFRLEIWQTNKPDLGYVKWDVRVRVPGLGWQKLDGTRGDFGVSSDRAEREGLRALEHWSKNYVKE